MESKIKFYRVLLNVLFYIFYVLLVSIAFSFIFPTVLVIFWKVPLNPNNPIFDNVQIWIVILVLILSLIYRKYFYLPIVNNSIETKKEDKVSCEPSKNEKTDKTPELDIKIGKEIK